MKKLTLLGYVVLGAFAIIGVISIVRIATTLFGILIVIVALGAVSLFAIRKRRS